jgi:hypothetical protein
MTGTLFSQYLIAGFCTGADLTHARGSDSAEPSIAAVCGSMDTNGWRFAARISVQAYGLEIIQVLHDCCEAVSNADHVKHL